MSAHHEMYEACKHVWRTGMKRKDGIDYVSKAVGFTVPEWQYVNILKTVLDLELGCVRKGGVQ